MPERPKKQGFNVLTPEHAEAILEHDRGSTVVELETATSETRIPAESLLRGGEAELTRRLRRTLSDYNLKHDELEQLDSRQIRPFRTVLPQSGIVMNYGRFKEIH